MFVWVKIPGVKDVFDIVMNNCIPNGVFVLPGNAFNYDINQPDQHIRLCYSYATPQEIDKVQYQLIRIINITHFFLT